MKNIFTDKAIIKKMVMVTMLTAFVLPVGLNAQSEIEEKTTSIKIELSTDELLQQANDLYDQREEMEKANQAVMVYRSILKQAPDNYEALWRLARTLFWIGDHEKDNQKALAVLSEGEALSKKATEVNPKGRDGLYWHGVCIGRASEKRGILNSLFSVDPLRKSMEATLAIDPEDGYAHHVLGVLYRKAPGWPLSAGDINKSLLHAKQAVKLEPNSVLCHMGLAHTLKNMGKKEEAIAVMENALQLPGTADMQPETKEDYIEIAEILKEWTK